MSSIYQKSRNYQTNHCNFKLFLVFFGNDGEKNQRKFGKTTPDCGSDGAY